MTSSEPAEIKQLMADSQRLHEDNEILRAGWVACYNHRRLHGSLGMLAPTELEQAHRTAFNREPQPA